jgi:hypothetical protein
VTIRLGQFIDNLEAFDGDLHIEYDDGVTPGDFGSWRGRYEELTLYPSEASVPRTVADVLRDANEADGKTFPGYKGGDFGMNLSTPVWADAWGQCPGRAIKGFLVERPGVLVIATSMEDIW